MSINAIVALCFVGFFALSFISLLLSLTVGLPLVATAFVETDLFKIMPVRLYSNIPKPKKYKDITKPTEYKKSTDGLNYFIVRGNSVKCFNIYDNNRLLVKKLNSIEKDNLRGKPCIIVQNHRGLLLSKYKIVKFIDYIDFLDIVSWEDIYDRHSNFLEKVIEKDYFAIRCRRITRSMKKNDEKQYILSVSFNEFSGDVIIHIDLINNIYGRVVKVVDDSTDF